MKVLYIGQYTNGTTSKMRADTLRSILQSQIFKIIDTACAFLQHAKVLEIFWF